MIIAKLAEEERSLPAKLLGHCICMSSSISSLLQKVQLLAHNQLVVLHKNPSCYCFCWTRSSAPVSIAPSIQLLPATSKDINNLHPAIFFQFYALRINDDNCLVITTVLLQQPPSQNHLFLLTFFTFFDKPIGLEVVIITSFYCVRFY